VIPKGDEPQVIRALGHFVVVLLVLVPLAAACSRWPQPGVAPAPVTQSESPSTGGAGVTDKPANATGFSPVDRSSEAAVSPTVAAISVAPEATATATVRPRAFSDPIFSRTDLIYGSELGSWQYDGRYDGYPLLTNQTCQRLSEEARIPIYRWMPWQPFMDLGGDMPVAQFDGVIDGIRSTGALVLIKLPPGVSHQCAPEADLEWLKEIVERAGDRVTIYEFGNETNYYCDWSAAQYAREWVRVVPALKRHARSLGFEIQIGGPAWSHPSAEDLAEFARTVKAEFDNSGDEDLIPSFLSFHIYASQDRREANSEILDRVPTYGQFIDEANAVGESSFGYPLPVAVTEWNFSVDTKDRRDRDPEFIGAFTTAMLREFRAHGLWLANQFTFASGDPNLDMVDSRCRPKPMFEAFLAQRLGDPG
jgi:hypothetical protein